MSTESGSTEDEPKAAGSDVAGSEAVDDQAGSRTVRSDLGDAGADDAGAGADVDADVGKLLEEMSALSSPSFDDALNSKEAPKPDAPVADAVSADRAEPAPPSPNKPPPNKPPPNKPPPEEYLSTVARATAVLLGAAASCGMALWQIVHRDLMVAFIQTNKIDPLLRRSVLKYAGGAMGVVLLAMLIYSVLRRKRRSHAARVLESVGWKLSPLCVAVVVPMVFYWQIWANRDIGFLLTLAIAVFAAQKLWYRALAEPPLMDWGATRIGALAGRVARAFEKSEKWLPWLFVLAFFAFYASYFSYYTVRNHWNLRTAAYDMAIEDNVVFNAMHGELLKASPIFGPEGTHLGHHATFFAYVLVPFYWLSPQSETLLIIQAILIGGAVIPLFLLARNRLGSYQGVLLCAMYIMYAPLHGANLYDFHYPPLAIGFVFWVAFLVDSKRYKLSVLPLLLALSVREDIALAIFALGAYFLLSRRRPRAGLVLATVGLLYFVGMKMGLMPYMRDGKHSFDWFYKKLQPSGGPKGFKGILFTILGNPGYTLRTLLEEPKIKYFLQVMVPFAFLPFRRGIGFVFCAPGLVMTLLSNRKASYDIAFQYTTHWAMEMFLASVFILAMIKEPEHDRDTRGGIRVWSWMAALAFAMAATSFQYGAVLQHNTARGGFWKFKFERTDKDKRRYFDLISLRELIPPDAKVSGTERVLPHVSNRADAYTIRTVGLRDCDYILFPFRISGRELKVIQPRLVRKKFGVVAVAGDFVLAKRDYDTARNAEVIARMGKPKRKKGKPKKPKRKPPKPKKPKPKKPKPDKPKPDKPKPNKHKPQENVEPPNGRTPGKGSGMGPDKRQPAPQP